MSDEQKTSRHRSPNFPSQSLQDSIEDVKKLFRADKLAQTTRSVAAAHLGHDALNGSAVRRLGSMSQYGLIENVGTGAVKVSALGFALCVPKEGEYPDSFAEALRHPRIFGLLLEDYGFDGLPSDQNLEARIIRDHKFAPGAAKHCVRSLRNSIEELARLRTSEAPGRSAYKNSEQDPHVAEVGASSMSVLGQAGSATGSCSDSHAKEVERIGVNLTASTRAEVVVMGPLGVAELRRLQNWLTEVVVPWGKYLNPHGNDVVETAQLRRDPSEDAVPKT